MCVIQMQLLQTPRITLDNDVVTLPFKKAEGLLYYMAVKKTISREQAAALFWSSTDEQTAKKNLRHALYTIKKAFNMEIIISPQKQILCLNPDITILTDYDDFLQNSRTELYHGEFLQGFYIKNAGEFEDWMTMERAALKDTYLQQLLEQISQLEPQDVAQAESIFKNYIREDPLEERIYYRMMQIYEKNRLYHKGIKVYEQLSKLLNEELQISPTKEVSALYRTLLNAWTEESTEVAAHTPVNIRGRDSEVCSLTRYYHEFLSGKPVSVFVSGENGVGKTYLMNHFLDSLEGNDCLILRTICFYQERHFAFQPWNAIMMQIDRYIQKKHLSIPKRYLKTISGLFPMFGMSNLPTHIPENADITYNYRAAHNSILKLFTLIGMELPVILFFDNIQFLDPLSLELLSAMIQSQNPNIMILATHVDILKSKTQHFINTLKKERLIQQLELKPFPREIVKEFLEERFGANAVNKLLLDQIYNETSGNAFFLETIMNHFTSSSLSNVSMIQAQSILADRILDISDDARQILDIISLFHDYASLETIEYISNRNTFEILDYLDELKEMALINETLENNQIRFQFRHSKMQEFVHGELSHSKRRLLHRKVADYLVHNHTPQSNYWYEHVIYHYTLCGDEPNVLKYRILELEEFSNYNFELYPVLNLETDAPTQIPQKMTAAFDELKTKLYQLYHRYPNAIDYSESEARLLYVCGKYYISQGYYDKGVPAIQQVLTRNEYTKEHPEFYIQCLRQLTFYGIQIWDTKLMEKSILECMKIEDQQLLTIDSAIELRLYGLLHSMRGDYNAARTYLEKAIEHFKTSSLRAQSFALNIAACYNYLGEAYRKQELFCEAEKYYRKAIEICTERNCPTSPTFYTNLARTQIAVNQLQEAKDLLKTANQLYDGSYTLMRRSIAKCCLACLESRDGLYENARLLMNEAKESVEHLASPFETGFVYLAKAALLYYYPDKITLSKEDTLSSLCEKALKYLSPLPGCSREITFIKQISDSN